MSSVYLNSGSNSSSSSTSSSSSLIRIPGMASGLDTDSIVKSMVSSYQTKIDKANQDEQIVQWKQDAYRDIIKGIKDLQNYFDPLSSKYIMGSNSLNINAATSDTTSVASATAGADANAGTYKVNVTQLATQAQIQGSSKDSLVQVTDLSKWSGQTLNFGSNGSITLSTMSSTTLNSTNMSNLAADINAKIAASSTLNGKVSASYVNDGTNSYIEFTSSSSGITLSHAASTVSEVASDVSINSGISGSSKLVSDLGFSATGGNISFKLTSGTTNYNVSLAVNSNTTVQNLMDAVNSATSGAVTMNIDDTTGKISFESKSYGSSSSIAIADTSTGGNDISKLGIPVSSTYTATIKNGTNATTLTSLGFSAGSNINFNLNSGGTNYNIQLAVAADGSTTIGDLMNAVNTATGTQTMSMDGTGKISFTAGTTITDTNTTNNTITTLGLSRSTASASGTDAIVAITAPGQSTATTTTQSSNNFTVNGVSYSLVSKGNANVTVTANTDNVVNNIKSFITDYNTIISTINTKLTEKKDNDYAPLTDAQKQSMSDSQITAWEAKAKVGILHNDDYLSQLMTQLRSVFSAPVYSNYNSSDTSTGKISLTFGKYGSNAIGIDTSSDVTDGGKLVITDENKLRSAITNNFDDFKKLFTGASSAKLGTNESYVGSEKYNEDGILKRVDTVLRDYVSDPGIGTDGTYTLSGTMNIFVNKQYDYSSYGSGGQNTLPDQIYSQTVNINKLKTQMSDAQTRYYNQFTQLETALSQLNSQQSSLSSMLGQG